MIALLLGSAPLSATDIDSLQPAPRRHSRRLLHQGPPPVEKKDATLRDEFSSWLTSVYQPVSFTNQTCRVLQREFEYRLLGRTPGKQELLDHHRSLVAVRRQMLNRCESFAAQTPEVKQLNDLQCEALKQYVDWTTMILSDLEASDELSMERYRKSLAAYPPELLSAMHCFESAYNALEQRLSSKAEPEQP